MIGASKILTVSYGTFSCTLEGFDEPFNTMKAIAEYFRDLAADDRYFGAEPPTPDAAMLHRIAEREIQRRVEAKIQENGVVLRAEEMPAPRVSMPAVMPDSVPPVVTPSVASAVVAAPAVESAAVRLSRLRAAQSEVPLSEPNEMPRPETVSQAIIQEPLDLYVEDEDLAPVASETPISLSEFIGQTATDFLNEAPEVSLPEAAPAAPFETDNDAKLLETVAGLIDQVDQIDAKSEAVEDDEDTTFDDVFEADIADGAGFVEVEAIELDDQFDLEPGQTRLEAAEAEIIDLTVAEDAGAPIATTQQPAAHETDESGDDLIEIADQIAPSMAPSRATIAFPEAELDNLSADEAAPIVAEKVRRARARVIKVRRAEAAAAAAQAPAVATVLSPEAEADLQRELATLATETQPASSARPAKVRRAERRHRAQVESQDEAVDRLIALTNSELEVPETKRRRSAIEHLKAAVAATVAERQVNPEDGSKAADVRMDPYRKDLDQVMHPKRAEGASVRPPPLVLVSEQRIDRVKSKTAPENQPRIVSPVRPRRVTTSSLAVQAFSDALDEEEDDSGQLAPAASILADNKVQSFESFVEQIGASGLSDLIEAAGAYCTLVLRRHHFTRPLLFQQIETLSKLATPSREDGLRGFGRLLREGRIVKVKRGKFAMSGASPVFVEAKRLAG